MQIQKEVRKNKRMQTQKTVWHAGSCALTIFEDSVGPYAYVFRHNDAVFSPCVTIYAVDLDKASVKVNLNFTHICVELRESERVLRNVREIEDFCAACVEEGLFQIIP